MAVPDDRKLRESLRDQSRNWLLKVLAESGMTANELARKANVSASNLHKLLNNPDYLSPIGEKNKHKISAATGIPLPGAAEMTAEPWQFSDTEIEPYTPKPADHLPYSEKNGCDWWTLNTPLLDMEGYLPGDKVLVNLNETARPGDIVVAQITSHGGRRTETVFRKYERPYLTCHTTSKNHPRPELVDGDRVVIMGVVVATWRERARTAA